MRALVDPPNQAMRLCARWWRKFSKRVIYPVALTPRDEEEL
jgi:hypothetical protein